MAKILLADDERTVRTSFKGLLEGEGHQVVTAKNGDEAVALFQAEHPDLVLLDVMMPNKNGIAACGEIRVLDPLVPILFFTALPSDVSLIRGLGVGADDYIAKDRSPAEFVARIGAALRRRSAYESAKSPDEVFALGAVTVDLRRMCVREGAGDAVPLTKGEALVLAALNRERGRYVDTNALLSSVHGEDYVGDPQAIRNIVSRLKKKLGRAGDLIVAGYRSGYMLIR